MSSSVWASFCSQESVSQTTWVTWHFSARVGIDGRGSCRSPRSASSRWGRTGCRMGMSGDVFRRSTRRWPGRCGRRRRRRIAIEQQQLGEGVVLAASRTRPASAGDAEQLREEPGLVVCRSSSPEVLLQRQLGEQKGDLLRRRRLRSSSVWMLGLADDAARSRSWSACRRSRATSSDSSVKRGCQPLAGSS